MDNDINDSWSSKFGFLMASAGSAVGLGNLWRFPFITANNGGGAFVLLYLILALTVGLTLWLLETGLGHVMKANPVDALKKINPRFGFIGFIGIVGATVIFSFYSVIGGWIIHYFIIFTQNILTENAAEHFQKFIQNPYQTVFYTLVFLFLSSHIVYKGVQNGIEKYSKIMMPALFVLIVVLTARSVLLPKAFEGLAFFFLPDFSKITTQTFLAALGQVFFSLSIGMGIFITYGMYMNNEKSLLIRTSLSVVVLDTLISVLAGCMIFPAVFHFGVSVNAGPTLVFITLPQIFAVMPFGKIVGLLFFVLLLLAALTSSISMIEVSVAYLETKFRTPRHKAVVRISIVSVLMAVPFSLSFGVLDNIRIFGRNLFDFADTTASNILLPLGGFLTCIAVGWFYGAKNLTLFKSETMNAFFAFMVKYLAPAAILLVFLDAAGLIKY